MDSLWSPSASDRDGDEVSVKEPDKVSGGEESPINGGGMMELLKTKQIRGSVVRGQVV